jgi:hypothetical protein
MDNDIIIELHEESNIKINKNPETFMILDEILDEED